MLLRLLSARDSAKRDWLQSFLGGELHKICAWDLHDLEAHVSTQSADTTKLTKLVNKLALLQEKTSQRFSHAEVELRDMEDHAQTFFADQTSLNQELRDNEA